MERAKVIERVRKLLALSSSDNEHEAAAAATKVQELLSNYNLQMSEIPGQDQTCSGATKAESRTRERLEHWAFKLARMTAYAFDCDYFHSTRGYTVFVGVGADQEVCAWTFSYLYKTLLRMGSSYIRMCPEYRLLRCQNRPGARKIVSSARQSYLDGAVSAIGQRLATQKVSTPITEAALVPVKEAAIKAAMPDNLRETKYKATSLRRIDVNNGFLDGMLIPISTPINSAAQVALL